MKPKRRFFYCPKCGEKLEYRNQDNFQRLTCISCSYIFYENPAVGVAAIVLDNYNRILLGQKNTGQFTGLWCIPCGYLEYNEDVYDGAKREFKEETNLDIEIIRVYSVQSNFHDPEKHTVGIWFLAQPITFDLKAGDDLQEIAYFDFHHLPPLAFPTDRVVIDLLKQEVLEYNRDQ